LKHLKKQAHTRIKNGETLLDKEGVLHPYKKSSLFKKRHSMKKIMLLYLTLSLASCKRDGYKFALLYYKIKDSGHTVRICDPAKLEILQKGILSLKEPALKIPIEYQFTIALKNGDTLEYAGNGSCMIDSSDQHYCMPEGKAKKDFVELLRSTARGMKIDEVRQ
jgi:hypothetical protein